MRLILPTSVAESLKRDPERIIAKYYKVMLYFFLPLWINEFYSRSQFCLRTYAASQSFPVELRHSQWWPS